MRPFSFTVGITVALGALAVCVVVGALLGVVASAWLGRTAASRLSGGVRMRGV